MQSIITHQTKPASEWIAGRVVQKVSPTGAHARAQGRLIAALLAWADRTGSGHVGTEWEFRVTPPGEPTRSLVPDVAFVSFARLAHDDEDATEIPYLAPDVAFEVLSPNDRRRNVDEKIRVYLASGTKAVIEVDPQSRRVTIHDGLEAPAILDEAARLRHDALPDFSMPVAAIFEKPKPRGRV